MPRCGQDNREENKVSRSGISREGYQQQQEGIRMVCMPDTNGNVSLLNVQGG